MKMKMLMTAVSAAVLTAAAHSDFTFYNIVPTAPGEEARVAREILDTYEKTGIDTPLVSMSLHPEGKPAWEKVETYLASYRALKKELAGTPVRPGILIQSILGHWPRQDKDIEPWTRTVDINGAVKRFCPLDPGFRKYIRDCAEAVAKEAPSFIMTDDDVRANSPELECFCPLHTAAFNKRTGRAFTPAQYRAAVKGCNNGDAVFTAFDRMRRDMICDVLAVVREGINAADPAIPTGVCMPWCERHTADAFAKTLADGHPATVRVANALYLSNEWNAKNLIGNALATMASRQGLADIETVIEESDTFPHSLYSKSALAMHTKLCTSAFVGINGSKIWFIGATKNGFPVSKRYTEILGKHRAYYPALARTARATKPAGVVFPARTDFRGENVRWYGAAEWFRPTPARTILAGFGVPVRTSFDYGEAGAVYALTGAADAWRFTDAQIKQLLGGRALIDGAAAKVLTQRGYAELLGVSAVPAKAQYNRQYWTGTKNSIPVNSNDAVELTNPAPGAEVVTELFYAATYMTKNPEKVGPGCVAFTNKLGGQVVTTVWNEKMEYASVSEATRDFFIKMLDRLSGGQMKFSTAEARPVLLLQRDAADGASVLQLVNLGFDPMDAVCLRTAAASGVVERLAPSGVWEPVAFTFKDGVLTVETPLVCYEGVVLRVK